MNPKDPMADSVATPVLQWIWEKDLYNQIIRIPIFKKFRKWKAFTMWHRIVRNNKSDGSSGLLTKRLFLANEVLQGCLLHVQSICEAASSSLTGYGTKDSGILLVDVDKNRTYTLSDFASIQSSASKKGSEALLALRKQIVLIVWESCAVLARLIQFLRLVDMQVLELLRRIVKTSMHHLLEFMTASANVVGEEVKISLRSIQQDPEEEEQDGDFSDTSSLPGSSRFYKSRPTRNSAKTYRLRPFDRAHRTDMTSQPYTLSPETTSTVTKPLSTSVCKPDGKKKKNEYTVPIFDFDKAVSEHVIPDADHVLREVHEQEIIEEIPEPIFSISMVLLNPVKVAANGSPESSRRSAGLHSAMRNVSAHMRDGSGRKGVTFPERVTSGVDVKDEIVAGDNESDIDGSSVTYISEDKDDDDDLENEQEVDIEETDYAYGEMTSRQPRKEKFAATKAVLSPGTGRFRAVLKDIINGFSSAICAYESLQEDPKLDVFCSNPRFDLKLNSVDPDDFLDADDDLKPIYPDTNQLFSDDPEYQDMTEELNDCMEEVLEEVVSYSQDYSKYCLMVDHARNTDITTMMELKTWGTDDFQQALKTHTEQINQMKRMTKKRRLGMIDLSADEFSQSCLPYPSAVIKAINNKLPTVAKKKNDDLLTIIKSSSKKLDQTPETVDAFVEHLSYLSRMVADMPALEREFNVVTRLYTIAKEFDVGVHPEHFALYQTLAPSFQHLKSTILYCEAKKEENIRVFSTDLNSLVRETRFTLMTLRNVVRDPLLISSETMSLVALEKIKGLQDEVQSLSTKVRNYANYQERFGTSLASSKKAEDYILLDRDEGVKAHVVQSELGEIERDLTLRRLLWESSEELTKLVEEWTATTFDLLNVESLQKNVNRFTQTVYMLEKGLPTNDVVPILKQRVTDFKQGMPVIVSLRNPSLRARHWNEIEALIGRQIPRGQAFTLGNLLEMKIYKQKIKIQDISTTASNEATLETMLQKVVALWHSTEFRFVPHQARDTHIVSAADDVAALLEESQVTIGTIRGSRYVTPIKTQVDDWERRLTLFSRTLDEWMNCQRNWLYLEQIFGNPDIQRQLPTESKLFGNVDKAWRDIMRRTVDRPNALKAATAPGVLEMLQASNTSLEKIHKCLEDYLETKRLVFPRFYFLSNDELLDILAHSKNPEAVQPHLAKCFANIQSLDIQTIPRQPPTVKSMKSAEGEQLLMPKNVRARPPVEGWLGVVETGMFDAVKKHVKNGLASWLGSDLKEWVIEHPGQVVLTVIQIMFNKAMSKCFADYKCLTAMEKYREEMKLSLGQLAELVSTELSSFKRLSVEALLTVQVHNRDIISSLIQSEICDKSDFEWLRQLRYEWDEQKNDCLLIQCDASFSYGYEYLGCSPRLVMTPLTDRCYLTLTGALHLHLGGSPAGPAGTGKTETVKDLAKSLGKQCVVFNCSEGLDYKMLGKFFSGLSQSGSWCCFDEFNRIDIEVLSVVAQQIHTIKTAKDSMAPRFMFEGREIRLNPTCGYFITMNPTYAGRVELPDNLKSLFRPVAMMVPHYALIAEIMLFSEGFQSAKMLSRKIVNLYQLASTQLSQQDHYDFGMRAIKSILVMAGHRKGNSTRHSSRQQPEAANENELEVEESYILIHSLRDANLPKFIAEDVPLFESLLEDLFPGMKPPKPENVALEKAISITTRDLGLQWWPSQIDKVKQLHSQLQVRHGVMLVGPTCGGKTTVRNILQKALVLLPTITEILQNSKGDTINSLNKNTMQLLRASKKGHVESCVINPKCCQLGELYGESDPNTFEWSDGLIASTVRRFAKELNQDNKPDSKKTEGAGTAGSQPDTEVVDSSLTAPSSEAEAASSNDGIVNWRWLVMDGPVDTMWVENLNTVLDDSKVLCLSNGERIALADGMRLLFEVDNLSQASPATISRCAMVYMDPVDLSWRPYVKTWLQRLPRELPESAKEHLFALFEYSIEKGYVFWRQHYKQQHVPAPELSLVFCLCGILSAFINFLANNGGFGEVMEEKPPMGGGHNRPGSAGSTTSSAFTDISARRNKRRRSRRQVMAYDEDKMKQNTDDMYFAQKNPSQITNFLGKLYVFSFVWSFGGNFERDENLDDDGGIIQRGEQKQEVSVTYEFDNFVHEVFDTEPPLGVRLPTGNKTIYSYFVDMKSGNFVLWDVLVPSTQTLIEKSAIMSLGELHNSQAEQQKRILANEIVPTVDSVRYSFLMAVLLLDKHPVLLTGESGVGKSALILNMIKQISKEGGTGTKADSLLGSVFNFADKNNELIENIMTLTRGNEDTGVEKMNLFGSQKAKPSPGVLSSIIQFSAQTSVQRTCSQVIQRLVRKGKDNMVGPRGRKVIVFIDDLNVPSQEIYGAQPPLELLRQFLDLGGFYDTKKLQWKNTADMTFAAACAPPGGGRNVVNPRLLKHFCMLALPTPSTRSLQHIYQVQLGKFLHEGDFVPEVKEALFSFVSGSIAIYYRMCNEMLPTPTKIHYTFNIRDLSQVIQGLLQANEEVIVNRDLCAQLLAHEVTRTFHDRLISIADREKFYGFLSEMLHDYFKVSWTTEQLMTKPILFTDFLDLDSASSSTADIYRPTSDLDKLRNILEEYHMRQHLSLAQMKKFVFFEEAVHHICRAVRVFRQPSRHMLMVGLDGTGKATVVGLACYIAGCTLFRLALSRGYSITDFRDDLKKLFKMAGVQGKSVVFLLTDSDIVKEEFLEDINCILNSGEVPGLFDNEEMDGIIMEIKQLASEQGVPDNRIAVFQFFIDRLKRNLHIVLTMSPAGHTFRQRCRMNPSLISCCTIDWYDEWSEEAMLVVANMYLPRKAFTLEVTKSPDTVKEMVGEICVSIHKSVETEAQRFWDEIRRRYYTTPSSYLEFIKVYSRMLNENNANFQKNRQRLINGLAKLSEANSLVGVMQEELVNIGPKIEEKAKETESLMEQLVKDEEAVDQVKQIVQKEESIMQKETDIVETYAKDCERDLAEVIPALETAITALDSLNQRDIAEIKCYMKPPVLVKKVVGAVQILLGAPKPDWASALSMLADAQFLSKLIHIDKDHIPEKIFQRLKQFTSDPDFVPDKVKTVSMSCQSICQWVLALEHYHNVFKMVKPKQKRVDEAKEALQLAQEHLTNKQSSLQKIMDHLALIQNQYQDSVNQREMLKERKKTTALRLDRASVLTNALADEKIRWADLVDELDLKVSAIVGDSLLSAAAVSYFGAFTTKYRTSMMEGWTKQCQLRQLPLSKGYDFVKDMAVQNQVLHWHTEGLPQDGHSVENAIIIKSSFKWPLLIDPQGQALHWIKETEGSSLIVAQADDPNYMRSMERALRVGDPIVLTKVTEELDPSLRPILLRDTFTRGGHEIITLGETEIEYNQNFRLYLITSLSNPHYLPAVCIEVSIINFTVTFDGLQEQLLSSVVKQENPQLETQRSMLLESIASDMGMLKQLEDKTLDLLQKSEGHILDDEDLISTLEQSKTMSLEIGKRMNLSEQTEKDMNIMRQKYLPVATRGAVLYFVLSELSSINYMYQWSLPWFTNTFISCIDPSKLQELPRKSADMDPGRSLSGVIRPSSRQSPEISVGASLDMQTEERMSSDRKSSQLPFASRRRQSTRMASEMMTPAQLDSYMRLMINGLTWQVYRVVSMALFSKHQLVFSFLLTANIMKAKQNFPDTVSGVDAIADIEWQAFLQGPVLANMLDEEVLQQHDGLSAMQRLEFVSREGDAPQRPNWVKDSMWKLCQHLEVILPVFAGLCRSIRNCHKQWSSFKTASDVYSLIAHPWTSDSSDKETEEVVFTWEYLSPFQRIMLVKVLRPDSLTPSMRIFIEQQMGDRYAKAPQYELREVFDEVNAKTPLIFLLATGSDPTGQILKFARDMRGSTLHLDMVSLGRGQGPKAEEFINKAQILKGRWVFLQNCHLAASWMPRLKSIVSNFSKPQSDVDPQFRLFLSSKPEDKFPVSILQTGIKVAVDAPQGVKSSLLRSIQSGSFERFYTSAKSVTMKNLLYGLCLFNSVIHERKKYGALGWNIPYEFNDSDLEVAMLQLGMLLDGAEEVPWKALHYLTGDITYGGRVTDDWDRRCLHALLSKFYSGHALQENHVYSTDGLYKPMPVEYAFSDIKRHITHKLPTVDSPSLFGMTTDSEMTCMESQARTIIQTVLSVQPNLSTHLSSGTVVKTSDEVVLEACDDMLRNIPSVVEDEEAIMNPPQLPSGAQPPKRLFTFQSLMKADLSSQIVQRRSKDIELPEFLSQRILQSALVTFLRQEVDRMNKLLETICKSLTLLCRAVKGEIIMSEELEDIYHSILGQIIPSIWKKVAYESMKPLGSWVIDLSQRVEYLSRWCHQVAMHAEVEYKKHIFSTQTGKDKGKETPSPAMLDNSYLYRSEHPRSYWISSFFFPQGFLTAVLQNHARQKTISIDTLNFEFTVRPNPSIDQEVQLHDTKLSLKVTELGFQGPVYEGDGILVFGLYLDGARWDIEQKCLRDSRPGHRFSRLPELVLQPTQIAAETSVTMTTSEDKYYACPLYRTSARAGTLSSTGLSTNFVTAIQLPSDLSPDFWVSRGVALLCQLDDA
ncbi:dynein axonemal heavy chain 6-like [Watersipora subatra]|uniref:dynein axonemal heavy chain 6-like n=1 Tax=Watersipora subatra TaxID=2589382 RepID=UPI00355BC6F3